MPWVEGASSRSCIGVGERGTRASIEREKTGQRRRRWTDAVFFCSSRNLSIQHLPPWRPKPARKMRRHGRPVRGGEGRCVCACERAGRGGRERGSGCGAKLWARVGRARSSFSLSHPLLTWASDAAARRPVRPARAAAARRSMRRGEEKKRASSNGREKRGMSRSCLHYLLSCLRQLVPFSNRHGRPRLSPQTTDRSPITLYNAPTIH